MFNVWFTRFLRCLRSRAAREVFADVASKLCVASIVAAGYLFYVGGNHASVAPWVLFVVAAMLFLAGLLATPEE